MLSYSLVRSCKTIRARFKIQPLHGTSTLLRIQFSWIKCRWAQEIQVMTKSSCFFWRKAHNLSLSVSLSLISLLCLFESQLLSSQALQRSSPVPSRQTFCFSSFFVGVWFWESRLWVSLKGILKSKVAKCMAGFLLQMRSFMFPATYIKWISFLLRDECVN